MFSTNPVDELGDKTPSSTGSASSGNIKAMWKKQAKKDREEKILLQQGSLRYNAPESKKVVLKQDDANEGTAFYFDPEIPAYQRYTTFKATSIGKGIGQMENKQKNFEEKA